MAETFIGRRFHMFYILISKNTSIEKPQQMGNFYPVINLKAEKFSVMKKIVKRAWEIDVVITVWEE